MIEAGTQPAQQSNSPFAQPIDPARTAIDAAVARQNSTVTRPDLAEARRVADLTPQQRFAESVTPISQGQERIGDRKLDQAAYDKLTISEKYLYAERQTALKNGTDDRASPANGSADPPAETKIAGDAPKKYKLGENFEVTEQEARSLMERDALEKSRALNLPKTPDEYKATLPNTFKAPDGIEYKIDEANPAFHRAREFAHANGFSQEQFSSMVAIHAAVEVENIANLKTARDAEIAKLGAAAGARVTAAQNFLRGHLGDDLGLAMASMMITAKHVEGFEKLMRTFGVTAAGGSFSHSAREPADARPRMTDAEFSRLSYSQQKEYSAQFSASESSGRR
jgi:hypothetical protein